MKPFPPDVDDPLRFSVNERDVDLLLFEQRHVSHVFRTQFPDLLGLPGAQIDAVAHIAQTGRPARSARGGDPVQARRLCG
ncbi:hypothetical protein [Loktanella sp. M215]|uniref:hypothetical protein n=1 Tax=Loktanella sp. M215 TaxID=2675431 RepID=UPI001F485794|nr:hypothetical protein [Loktanella sp. M215]MCF7699150.1 hypothetical protein [Loktanella sp. M215]